MPPPPQLFQSLSSVQFQAYAEQFWSISHFFGRGGSINRKNKNKKTQQNKPQLQRYAASTHRGREGWGRERRSQFPCPSHSHPVGGGLPVSADHHPAGGFLLGRLGRAEEGAAGAPPGGGGSSPGNTVHAPTGCSESPPGGVLKA